MGKSLQNSWQRPSRSAGIVRRVVRHGEDFFCGLCRSPYGSFDEAMQCVRGCWAEVLRLNPVLERRPSPRELWYRCRFCARDHGTRDQAFSCAKECKALFSARFDQETQALGLPLEAEPPLQKKRSFQASREIRTVIVKPIFSPRKHHLSGDKTPVHKATEEEPKGEARDAAPKPSEAGVKDSGTAKEGRKETLARQGQASGHGAKDKGAETQASHGAEKSHAETGESKADKKEVSESSGKEPFTRSGAQYICTGCSKKYFTRDEVVKCFESHGQGASHGDGGTGAS